MVMDGKLTAVASSRSRPCAAATTFRTWLSAAWIQISLTEITPTACLDPKFHP
jgi:hypothetical protein